MQAKILINHIDTNKYASGRIIDIQTEECEKFPEDILDYRAILPFDAVDISTKLDTYDFIIGEELTVEIVKIDEENQEVAVDRAAYQRTIIDEYVEKKGPYEGKIMWNLKYGAMVKTKEGFLGLIKNTDFSDRHLKVSDFYKPGDTLQINILKRFKDKLYFEPVDKSHEDYMPDLSQFKEGDIVIGRVTSIKPWGIFINLAPGIDGLCNTPPIGVQVGTGQKVAYRIVQVDEVKGIRGRFVKVL